MPRNVSGVYTLPASAGNPVVSATTIEPDWANQTLNDIADALTASLPRDGAAPMTGQLLLAGDAAVALAAVPKQQLDAALAAISTAAADITNTPAGNITATDVQAAINELDSEKTTLAAALAAIYPVGSVYINASVATNPGTLLGFGTWVAFGAGRVPVGIDAGNAAFNSAEETGGSADAVVVSHSHTVTDPGHAHTSGDGVQMSGSFAAGTVMTRQNSSGITGTSTTGITLSTDGVSGTNANLQPYIVVHMWKRTA